VQVAIGVFPGFTALDAVGPMQLFGEVPGNVVVLCAERRGRLDDEDRRLHLDIEHTFADVTRPDLVVVPGGCASGRFPDDYGPVIDWVRTTHADATYTTSVCMGALVLGEAGLLDGRAATAHWRSRDALVRYGARPSSQRVVFDDKVVTATGMTAGIDLALALILRLHGAATAQAIQLVVEYDPQPPFDTGAVDKAPPEVAALAEDFLTRTDRTRHELWPGGRNYASSR
jgi:transcriptional regulator GlxA family with amidase domain